MPFEKGKAPPNPGGLTVRQMRTRRIIEGLGQNAAERLGQLLQSDNETIALGAAKEILARVAPIPKQAKLDVSVEHGPNAHLAALISLARKSAQPSETPPILDVTPQNGQSIGQIEQMRPLAVSPAQSEQDIAEMVHDAIFEDDDGETGQEA
jgi:hypothetical protein